MHEEKVREAPLSSLIFAGRAEQAKKCPILLLRVSIPPRTEGKPIKVSVSSPEKIVHMYDLHSEHFTD